ncbi:MAG: 1-deoxy-D-xylulose-5-phosphate reductoisomerase [Bacteroidia bacterium]|nr:1-deoxy-D-xylulose-5-phosphate reductoisomerase [Bacteroidia bacterium]MDW8133896.1 1-deoxy-D-xylulose-5-phosphate reductoisomerase [Bacteroidia bacterium]
MRHVTVLGASGSIGRQALSLIATYPERYRVEGLSVHRQISLLPQWIEEFSPRWIAVTHFPTYRRLRQEWNYALPLLSTQEMYEYLAVAPGDIVLNGIVGSAGFWASWHTLYHSRAMLALANKESLVFGGPWLVAYRQRILPVDSEHSALFQCLVGEGRDTIKQLILTASGGPFRGKKKSELLHITPREALRHPVWRMGARITVDSATLMNKALELIEAHWLFGVPEHQIEVWIHPECILHSLVIFQDNCMKAQLSKPDMRLPILYALSYPERVPFDEGYCNLPLIGNLHFEEVDENTFPSVQFAREALRKGGSAAALLNAADEIVVEAFLEGKIGFLDIFDWLTWTLAQPETLHEPSTPEELSELEREFRIRLRSEIGLPMYAGRE